MGEISTPVHDPRPRLVMKWPDSKDVVGFKRQEVSFMDRGPGVANVNS